MSRGDLLILGLVAFVGLAVANVPASHLYGWFANASAYPRAEGLDGTLSDGAVNNLRLNNKGGSLGKLSWDLQAWKLLLARASFHLQGGSDGLLLDGTAAALPSRSVLISDFRLGAPLTRLASAAGYSFVPAQASVGVDLSHLKLRKGLPKSAKGMVKVDQLRWTLGKNAVLLGDYEVSIEDASEVIKAIISTLQGPLQVQGEANLKPDQSWTLDLRVKPEADAPPAVSNLISAVGRPDSQGWRRIQQKGTLGIAP